MCITFIISIFILLTTVRSALLLIRFVAVKPPEAYTTGPELHKPANPRALDGLGFKLGFNPLEVYHHVVIVRAADGIQRNRGVSASIGCLRALL